MPSVLDRLRSYLPGAMPRAKPMTEMGVSGTSIHGGYIMQRDKSPLWTGQQRYTTAAELASNISIIAASLHHFLNLIAHAEWSVVPADEDSAEAKAAAEWVEEIMHGMVTPWYRVVRKSAMYRFHGFSIQEWTASRRDDGTTGFKDIESRPQHTIEKWEVDEDGSVLGCWQRSPQTGELFGLPRAKIVYLVDDTLTDSPEGQGIFRHMAEPYERLKQFFALEMRAYERDFRGLPMGRAPLAKLQQAIKAGAIKKEDAESMVNELRKLVEMQVTGKNSGIVLDSAPYINISADGPKVSGVQEWGLDLLNGSGRGFQEIAAAIDRTQREMARIIGTEHLMMGDQGGNRALSADKSRNLYLIANSVLKNISSQYDQDVLTPLWQLNGLDDAIKPSFATEDVTFKDVEQVTGALARMAQAGAVLSPQDPVVDDVRDLLGVSRHEGEVDPGMLRGAGEVDDNGEPIEEPTAKSLLGWRADPFDKSNPNHDDRGRFSSGDDGTDAAEKPVEPKVFGDGKNAEAIKAAHASLPEAHQAFLLGKVELVTADVVHSANSGRSVLGTHEQTGPFSRVIIADKVVDGNGTSRKARDPEGTAVHELGHALDSLHGWRFGREIADTVLADAERMSEAERSYAKHYLKNPREMFAETYRLTYSKSGKGAFGMGPKKAARVFAKSIEAVRNIRLRGQS